jgi:acetoacetyl-CoA reductase
MTKLTKRVALVTGGSRGIGKAIAISLAEAGAAVAVNYREKSAEAEAVAKAVRDNGGKAMAIAADVSKAAEVARMVAAVERELGPVDVLVNNAGITRDGTMRKMSRAQWDEVIDVNLGGCFNMAKAVFDGMTGRKYGRVVNIGSINGQAGQYGQVNYAAAKSGIHGFTKALAQEGARFGVTVNAIAPGYIDTDMVAAVPEDVLGKIVAKIPVGRLGKADEIARGVAFLVDENGGFVTGSTLSINGGQHMY